MNDLEAQVERGQANLGRLIRQFFIINEYKHVQLMQMANSLTGIRWLHSSQISTLKRAAARNLTGFPLYSLALVNRKIWEINNDKTKTLPVGTRMEDWLDKRPMMNADNTPVDIGDLWRIYFGEMEAPVFYEVDTIEIDDELAIVICSKLASLFAEISKTSEEKQITQIEKAIDGIGIRTREKTKLLKGLFLGVTELSAIEIKENAGMIARLVHALTGKEFTEQNVYEMCLENRNASME
jgi:hypothetical protein